MLWKEIISNELYVYYNGKLLYKKWLKTGASLIFDKGFCWSPEALEALYRERKLTQKKNIY